MTTDREAERAFRHFHHLSDDDVSLIAHATMRNPAGARALLAAINTAKTATYALDDALLGLFALDAVDEDDDSGVSIILSEPDLLQYEVQEAVELGRLAASRRPGGKTARASLDRYQRSSRSEQR